MDSRIIMSGETRHIEAMGIGLARFTTFQHLLDRIKTHATVNLYSSTGHIIGWGILEREEEVFTAKLRNKHDVLVKGTIRAQDSDNGIHIEVTQVGESRDS